MCRIGNKTLPAARNGQRDHPAFPQREPLLSRRRQPLQPHGYAVEDRLPDDGLDDPIVGPVVDRHAGLRAGDAAARARLPRGPSRAAG